MLNKSFWQTEREMQRGKAKELITGEDYEIMIFETVAGRPCAHFYARKAGKAKWRYSFRSEEAMRKFIGDEISSWNSSQTWRREQKAKKNAPHTLKVGDLLSSSWGYDQTNIDFYQVVEVIGAHTVKIEKIGGQTVRSTGWASEIVKANPEHRTGEFKTARAGADNSVKVLDFGVWAYPCSADSEFHETSYA